MIRFIDKNLFDARSFVSPNYDWNLLIPIVEHVQFMFIKRYLGSDLYTALQAKVQAYMSSGTEIAAAYKTLLDDYIIPSMVWHIKAEMAISAKFRVKPNGIMESAPDNNTPISTEDLKWFIDDCRNKGETYGQELINYLIAHASASYPEYSTNSGVDKTRPDSVAYNSPFYTRKRPRYFGNDEGPIHD